MTDLVVGVVSCGSISLGTVGYAIGNAVGLVTLGDTLCPAVVVADGACSGESLVDARHNNAYSITHTPRDRQPRWIERE